MSKVKPKGGLGHEAIEVCLQAINNQLDVSQVILIGDAPWNTDKEVR
jgi:hypothetical protein